MPKRKQTFQVTENAMGEKPITNPLSHSSKIYQTNFKPSDHAPAQVAVAAAGDTPATPARVVNRPVENDIFEIMRLPRNTQIKSASIVSSAEVRGTYALRILGGILGTDITLVQGDTAANTRDTDVTVIAAVNGAAANDVSTAFVGQRKAADIDKELAVALVCTATAAANETATLTIALEYYSNDQVE